MIDCLQNKQQEDIAATNNKASGKTNVNMSHIKPNELIKRMNAYGLWEK